MGGECTLAGFDVNGVEPLGSAIPECWLYHVQDVASNYPIYH